MGYWLDKMLNVGEEEMNDNMVNLDTYENHYFFSSYLMWCQNFETISLVEWGAAVGKGDLGLFS